MSALFFHSYATAGVAMKARANGRTMRCSSGVAVISPPAAARSARPQSAIPQRVQMVRLRHKPMVAIACGETTARRLFTTVSAPSKGRMRSIRRHDARSMAPYRLASGMAERETDGSNAGVCHSFSKKATRFGTGRECKPTWPMQRLATYTTSKCDAEER